MRPIDQRRDALVDRHDERAGSGLPAFMVARDVRADGTSQLKRSEEAEREFREEIIPTGEALRSLGLRFPVVVGRMGAAYHAWAIEHLRELEAELRAETRRGHAVG